MCHECVLILQTKKKDEIKRIQIFYLPGRARLTVDNFDAMVGIIKFQNQEIFGESGKGEESGRE